MDNRVGFRGISMRRQLDSLAPKWHLALPPPPSNYPIQVKELINEATMTWNLNGLAGFTSHEEENAIRQIPLSRFMPEDHIIWKYDKSGQFSVKSAYGALVNNTASNPSQHTTHWKLLWGLPVLTKIKLFTWRAMHEAIAVNKALNARIPTISPISPMCNLMEESVLHSLVQCEVVKSSWNSPLPSFSQSSPSFISISQWFSFWLAKKWSSKVEKRKFLSLMVILLWCIWIQHNKVVFNHPSNLTSQNVLTPLGCFVNRL